MWYDCHYYFPYPEVVLSIMQELSFYGNVPDDILSQEICERLLERLLYFKVQPSVVVDLCCRQGLSTKLLKQHFSSATVIGVDNSYQPLRAALKKRSWFKKFHVVNAPVRQLPLADEAVDFILIHQLIASLEDMASILQECFRVLKPGGCLLFSTLGPDSFKEVSLVNNVPVVDMHDVGDLLISCGFSNPVMDRDDIVLRYQDARQLGDKLSAQNMALQLPPSTNELTFEVIYGHAWRGRKKSPVGVQAVSISQIKKLPRT